MGMQKNKTIFGLVFSFLIILNLSIAFAAGNTYTFNFYDRNTNTPLTNVEEIFYSCNFEGCADPTEPTKFSTNNSGVSNSISQEYLGTSQSSPQDYLAVMMPQCYLPLAALTQNDWGYGYSENVNAYFFKGENCHSPIYSYNVTNTVYENEPITINVEARLDAATSSAFKKTGFPPLFTPNGYENYFSAQTLVTLTITNSQGQIVNTQTMTLNLLADTTKHLTFSWTPTIAGDYNAKITTDVTDCQCASQIQENVQKDFKVLSQRPQAQCYTLLNNLQSNIIFPFVNDTITLSVGDLSNHAANVGALTPVSSTLTWTITQLSTNQIVYSSNTNVAASNSNSAYVTSQTQFTPTTEGQYLVSVTGTPNSPLCAGLGILPETTQMTLTISKQPLVCTDVDNDGYSQEGGNCGARDCADTNPTIHPNALEICDSLDNNCNGQIDETLAIACSNNAQCDDNNPLTSDICQNAGTCSAVCTHITPCTDNDHDGFFSDCGFPVDCNDNNAQINPNQRETCNGIDNNCDGQIDNILLDEYDLIEGDIVHINNNLLRLIEVYDNHVVTINVDGIIQNITLSRININGLTINLIDSDSSTNSARLLLNDFNNIICLSNAQCDDGLVLTTDICQNAGTCNSQCIHTQITCTDNDGDGFSTQGGVCGQIDCNDNNAAVNPNAIETCNGIDDDCDGQTDENNVCAPICDSTSGQDCSSAQNIFSGVALTNMCGINQYYTISLTQTCDLTWTLTPTQDADYDLYTTDITNQCVDNSFACISADGSGAIDTCSYTQLSPGSYSAKVSFFSGNGSYNIQADLTNCRDVVNENVSFEIIATPQKGVAPLQVFFSENIFSGNAPFTYIWDFGDGHFSFESNPTFIFYGEKLHPVTLTIFDSDGDSATGTIDIDTRKEHALDSLSSMYVGDATPVNEILKKGENLVMVVSFENRAGKALNDVTFQVSIPEIGVLQNYKAGKVSNGKTISKTISIDMPRNVASGHYFVRTNIVANSGEVKRTVYREIVIR